MPTLISRLRIIVWSFVRSHLKAGVFAATCLCLIFGMRGSVARPQAFATLGEAIAAALPAPPVALAQEAYLKASNTDAADRLGYAVAIDGDTAVLTSINESSNATGVNGDQTANSALTSGAAYVFVRTAGGWSQQAYLKASNTDANDQFGSSVAIDGDTIVVGAEAEDSNATTINGLQTNNSAGQAGAAYVFVRNGTTWSQQAYLKPSNMNAQDHFGVSVAVSGDTIAVGAIGEDSTAPGVNGDGSINTAQNAGAAYIFTRSGTTWTQQAYIKSSNPAGALTGDVYGDVFGRSVSLDGNTLVVGAANEFLAGGGEDSAATYVNGDQTDNSAPQSGAAYVFVRNGTTWSQQAYLKAPNTGADDRFGYSVGVSGDTIVVGAFFEDSSNVGPGVDPNTADNTAADSGAAYVYVRTGTTWAFQSMLKASNTGAGDRFGMSVAIDGDRIVVGAPQEDGPGDLLSATGAVYVFNRTSGVWTQSDYLRASNPDASDQVGLQVAVSGDTVLASSLAEDSNATGVNGNQADNSAGNAGAGYVFVPATNQAPTADAGADQFVAATSASGATVTLSGAGSSDPDGDGLTYSWSEGAAVVGTGPSPSFAADFGTHTYTLTVDDGRGLQATDTVVVTVADVFTVSIASPSLSSATYTYGQVVPAAYTCSDSAGMLSSCVGPVEVGAALDTLSLGTHLFNVTATNSRGETSGMTVSYTVTKATSTVAVSCTPSVTYTGAAQEACNATVTGAGGLSTTATVSYTNNTNVGTASATSIFAGDANHDGSNGSATFDITKASLTVTADSVTRAALAPNPVFTGTLAGVVGADGITATYDAAAATMPGTYPIVPTLVDPNGRLGNYAVTSVNGVLTVVDTDPPVVHVPASVTAEAADASGAIVNFADQVSAVDAVFGGVAATCAPASGTLFPIGDTTVTCTAVDGVGNLGGASFIVTVRDTTAPTLTTTDMTVTATAAAGITVEYAPLGHDAVSGDVTSVCSPTSGSLFTIGDHQVSCTATDSANNTSAISSFTVHVLDGVAPTVHVPATTVAEATSALGATVNFTATSSDNVDETLTTTCAPASGSVFALGDTPVTCTATDAGGNTGTATFTVTVRDTTAPTLNLPTVAPVISATPTVVLTYTATATDLVDGTVSIACTPASGSAFPIGSTTVTCATTDAHGNSDTGSFVIKVNDGISPTVTVSPAGDRTVEATSSAGAVVTFTATASDNVDTALPTTCSPASGSTFPVGPATLVTCSATDASGNIGTSTFFVTVVDTTPPTITVPAPITQSASAATGAAVTYITSATDLVSGSVPVTCAPASGATFPVGTTTVHCTAADARGNAASADFTVTVQFSQSGIGQFVAFSKDNTRLKSQVTVVSGDIGANERRANTSHGHRREGDDGDRDDITVQIGEKSVMRAAESRVVGDTVNLMSKAKVYNVIGNFLINREAQILGTITRPMAIPFLTMPTAPTVTAGTAAVTVKKNTTRTLAAGAYGAIKVENGATLIMTGGTYQVLSIDVDPQGTILFRGASEVRVKNELETGSKSKIVLDQTVSGLRASQIVFYVLGGDAACAHNDRDDDGDDNGPASVHIGSQNVVQANIYAVNGTLWLKSKTQATGAFIGAHVRIGERVTLTLDSAFR